MAGTVVKIKQSSVAGNTPTTSQIVQGELAINTADKKLYSNDGTAVFEIGASSGGAAGANEIITTDFTATNAQTSFAVSYTYANDHVNVYYNGIKLSPDEYTATNGSAVVLDVGAVTGATISIEVIKALSLANGSDITEYEFTATAGQTTFAISGGYQNLTSDIEVYINGVKIPSADFTATNDTQVVLGTGAAVNDQVAIRVIKVTVLTSTVSQTSDTGAAIIPAGTTAQRDGSPAAGYLRFNTTLNRSEVYNGNTSAWQDVGAAGDSTKLPLAGGTMSGDIAMGGNDITGGGGFTANTLTAGSINIINAAVYNKNVGSGSREVTIRSAVDSSGDIDTAGWIHNHTDTQYLGGYGTVASQGGGIKITQPTASSTVMAPYGVDSSGNANQTLAITATTFTGALTGNVTGNASGSAGTVTSIASHLLDEDNMATNSATKVPSQQSVKAYVDTQVATVPVGDITSVVAGTGLTGGGTSGDVTVNVIGGTGITANADDIAIDSTVTTLTGTQTLSAKTLTSPVINTGVSGSAILDSDTMAGTSATTLASSESIKAYVDAQTTDETAEGSNNLYYTTARWDTKMAAADTGDLSEGSNLYWTNARGDARITAALIDEDNMSSNSATRLPSQQSVKAYVDSQVTAQDLDFSADSGGALSIDLDSEAITFTGGTGITTVGNANDVSIGIDATVATLTGTQILTNKTLTGATLSGTLTGNVTGNLTGNLLADATTLKLTTKNIISNADSVTIPNVSNWGGFPMFANAGGVSSATKDSDQTGGGYPFIGVTQTTSSSPQPIAQYLINNMDYDISGGLSGHGVAVQFAAQAESGKLIDVASNLCKLRNETVSGSSGSSTVDDWEGEYTLTVIGNAGSGASNVQTNVITTNTDYTQIAQEIRLVDMPGNSGTANLSRMFLNYDGAQTGTPAADIGLYNHSNTTSYPLIGLATTGISVTGNIAVTGTVDGRDVAADGTKLDTIETSATADQTAAEIVALVEAGTDSNTFTDADHTKLNAIEASADVTDTTNVVAALTAGTGVTISSGGTIAVGPVALTTVQVKGSQVDQLAATTQEGDVIVRSDEKKSYMHNGGSAGTMADFSELQTPDNPVLSVNGQTGAITAAHIAAAVEAASGSNTFTDADHTKLNAIEASATADQTNAEIKAAVEAATDSNTFTDADHSKLNAIEASATADQTAAEIRTLVGAATDSNVYTDALNTKLAAIEALADVTDATNVNAAGAVMNADASIAAMGFVVDEDNMASNSATKLSTQQSIKAYVDAQILTVPDAVAMAIALG